MHTASATTDPVFTDTSGKRAFVLQWAARIVGLCGVILAGAVAFTLLTHVSLPGLRGLVPGEPRAQSPHAAQGPSSREAGLMKSDPAISTSNAEAGADGAPRTTRPPARTRPQAVRTPRQGPDPVGAPPQGSPAAMAPHPAASPQPGQGSAARRPPSEPGSKSPGRGAATRSPASAANSHRQDPAENPRATARRANASASPAGTT